MVIDMNKNFSCGNRIKQLRTDRSLSQERLALNAGITPAYLGLLERGKKNATVLTIEKICSAMNISLAEFFSDATEKSDSMANDTINQVALQLSNLSENEKQAFLQITKQIVNLIEE